MSQDPGKIVAGEVALALIDSTICSAEQRPLGRKGARKDLLREVENLRLLLSCRTGEEFSADPVFTEEDGNLVCRASYENLKTPFVMSGPTIYVTEAEGRISEKWNRGADGRPIKVT